MTLKGWIRSRFLKRLALAGTAFLAFELAFLGLFLVDQQKQFEKDLSGVVDSISIALVQKNQELVDSTLTSAANRWHSTSIDLCSGNGALFSLPTYISDCGSRSDFDIFKVTAQIPGRSATYLAVKRSPLFEIRFFLVSFVIAALFFAWIFKQLSWIYSELNSGLIDPLLHSLFSSETLPILELENLRQTLQDWKETAAIKARSAALTQVANQLAHDIRSPISALKMVAGSAKELPDEKQQLLGQIADRITSIADDLLSRNRSQNQGGGRSVALHTVSLTNVDRLLEQVVREKKVTFLDRVDLGFTLDLGAHDVKCCIDENDLMRLVSNLINNSVEAIPGSGLVSISLRASKKEAFISIADNGIGIPESIIEKIGTQGFSYGKEEMKSGNGLGVFHARQTVERAGGRFRIQSKIGHGTIMTVILPRIT